MSFGDLERVDANDSIFLVLWESEYIYIIGWQVRNFGKKQHSESIH